VTMTDTAGTVFPRHQLGNGLQIIGQPMPNLESVSVGFMIGAGSRDERAAQTGLSHLVEMMGYQGTKHRDARALTEAFDRLGARKTSGTDLEYTTYSAMALGSQLVPLVELLSDVVRYPGFNSDEYPKAQDRVLQEIAEREDVPLRKIMDLLRRAYFGEHPYGNERLGEPDGVASIPLDALHAYWGERYGPRNTVLAVAGKVDWEAFIARAEELLGDWQGPAQRTQGGGVAPAARVVLEQKESNQQHIGLAVPGVAFSDPDRYTMAVLSTLLGGSMNSRLFVEVREKRGLVYSVGAFPFSLETAGLLGIYAGTTPDKADQTVAVCTEQLRRLEDEPPTDEEVERAKILLKADVIMRSESSDARRRSIATGWWYEGKVRTLEEIAQTIDAVDAGRIQAMCRRLEMSKHIAVAAIGPVAEEGLLKNVR